MVLTKVATSVPGSVSTTMSKSDAEKFDELFASVEDTQYVIIWADGLIGIDVGYCGSKSQVFGEVMKYAVLNSVKQVKASFGSNIMDDSGAVLAFDVSYAIGFREQPKQGQK